MPWLLITAIGAGSAFVGSLLSNLSQNDAVYTHPAAVKENSINLVQVGLYAAGAISLVILAKKADLIK